MFSLQQVAGERQARLSDAALEAKVRALKAFQHSRFAHTYADFLADSRFAGAARFFLEDIYGPADFSERDSQFERIVPALVRLFPSNIVATVADLTALHALSEQLDSAMGRALSSNFVGTAAYGVAWRQVGDQEARDRQLALMVSVGEDLDRYTRNPLLRHSLRLMRAPASAAGLSALQRFLETGFDTFRHMRGAKEFLETVAGREKALAARLFLGDPEALAPFG